MRRVRGPSSPLANESAGLTGHLEQTDFQNGDAHSSAAKEFICSPPLESTSEIELKYPDRIVAPPSWLGHIPFAFWIVGALKPRTIVELGVHSGNSYCAFLQAVRTISLETRCFGVDHWKGDSQAGNYGDELYNELRAYHDPIYGALSSLVRASFDDAVRQFADRSIDLLHIDGFHTYEAVSHDFKTWLPKMSSRGVVMFHDTNVREESFGVWRYWAEIASRYPSFEFIHSHGLGVAYVGTETLPAALESLFSSQSVDLARRIRSYFSRLGTSIIDRYSARQLDTSLHQQLHEAKRDAEELRKVITATRSEVEQYRQHTAELNCQVIELQSARSDLSRQSAQNDTLTIIMRHQNAAISRLQRELIKLHNDRKRDENICRRLESECGGLKEAYRRLESEYEGLKEAHRNILLSTSWRVTGLIRFMTSKLYQVLGFSGRRY
jgi:O-antigen biosynthesis protein